MKRARVVEITFAPKLSRMPEITLRKNASLTEPRIGVALGKIVHYSIALDGSDGRIKCEVRIGCTIGRGGMVTETAGTPTYCSIDYVGNDYQQFNGRTIAVNAFGDTSVGYAPPVAAPNDDGINFPLSAGSAIESMHVEYGPEEQESHLQNVFGVDGAVQINPIDPPQVIAARSGYLQQYLKVAETRAIFKLRPMSGSFSTNYVIQMTDLKIPTGYNLEMT
jgi:hypothetical protein